MSITHYQYDTLPLMATPASPLRLSLPIPNFTSLPTTHYQYDTSPPTTTHPASPHSITTTITAHPILHLPAHYTLPIRYLTHPSPRPASPSYHYNHYASQLPLPAHYTLPVRYLTPQHPPSNYHHHNHCPSKLHLLAHYTTNTIPHHPSPLQYPNSD